MPLSSINTNLGAMAALQSLQATATNLSVMSSRISTGSRVASSADNAAFSVTSGLRSTMSGLAEANRGLEAAKSQVGSGMAAGQSVTDTLSAMRTLAVQATGLLSSDQRSIVQKQMDTLRTQLDAAAGSSSLTSGANQDMAVTTGGSSTTIKSADLTSQGLGLAAQTGTDTTASGAASVLAVQVQTGQQPPAGADPLDLSDHDAAVRAVATLDKALKTASSAATGLGVSSRRIDTQIQFNSVFSDSISAGLGALADADLAAESAKLQSLQVRQQLGIQSLSLANQAPQSLLSLFR